MSQSPIAFDDSTIPPDLPASETATQTLTESDALRRVAPGPAKSDFQLIWRLAGFAGLVLLAHAVSFALALPFAAAGKTFGELAAIGLSGIGVLIVSRIVLRRAEGVPLGAIGIGRDRPWLRHLIGGTIVGGMLIAFAWIAFELCGWQSYKHTFSLTSTRVIQLAIAALYCVATAVHEEAVCRGYAFQALYRRRPVAAVILFGLLFAAIHAFSDGGTEPIAILNLFIAHLLFVAVFLRTRSLWLPIGLHAGWNFVEAFVLGMPISGRKPVGLVLTTTTEANLWTGHAFGPEGGLAVTLILAIAALGAWLLLRQRLPALDLIGSGSASGNDAATATSLTSAPPTAPGKRIAAIDVLRGIAILGILPMNMQIFALHPAIVFYPYAGEFTDATNIAAWTFLRIFIGSTDLYIFSMLFGAGILMVEASQTPREAVGLHYRRMAVLLVFGLAHAYLIWAGDILVTYAIVGSLVFLLRGLRPLLLTIIGTVAFLVPIFLLALAHFVVPQLPSEWQTGIRDTFIPTAAAVEEFNRSYGGSWLSQLSHRASDAIANQTVNVLLIMGWIAGGMMLIGMAMQKTSLLKAVSRSRTYAALIAPAVVLGLPLLLYSFVWNSAREWRIPDGFFLGLFFREFAYGLIAIGWVGGVMLLGHQGWLGKWSSPLSAVGRMALSNYLLQSIICSLIFYGHGLGRVGQIDHVGQLWITAIIWTGQLIASPIWLSYFRFGPAEWLWRSLAYGEWQPMRKIAATERFAESIVRPAN